MTAKLVLVVALAACVTAAGVAQERKADPHVAGTWNMMVKGPAAHGDMPATLVLKQSGTRVTGSMSAHGNEHTVAGTFADATLELETTDTPADKALTFNAKLQANGTLSGYLSGPMGDMTWTASRAKDSQ